MGHILVQSGDTAAEPGRARFLDGARHAVGSDEHHAIKTFGAAPILRVMRELPKEALVLRVHAMREVSRCEPRVLRVPMREAWPWSFFFHVVTFVSNFFSPSGTKPSRPQR